MTDIQGPAIILGPAAKSTVLSVVTNPERNRLATELRDVFAKIHQKKDVPSAYKFDVDGNSYLAVLLPSGFAAIYRELTPEELDKQGRSAEAGGYLVADLLDPSVILGPDKRRSIAAAGPADA